MEYFRLLQQWISDSRLYQDVLRQMPPPCDNLYFVTAAGRSWNTGGSLRSRRHGWEKHGT